MTPLTIRDLTQEIEFGRAKFPGRRFFLPALVEEVGELVDAMLLGDRDAIYKEALQIAGLAIRIAEEGDSADYTRSIFAELVSKIGQCARGILQRKPGPWTQAQHLATWLARRDDDTFATLTAEEMQP